MAMTINHNTTSLISAYKNVGNIQSGQRLTSGQDHLQGLRTQTSITNDAPPPSVIVKFGDEAIRLNAAATTKATKATETSQQSTQEIDRRTALSNIKEEDFATTTSTNLSKSVISVRTEAADESSNRQFTSQTQNLLSRLPPA